MLLPLEGAVNNNGSKGSSKDGLMEVGDPHASYFQDISQVQQEIISCNKFVRRPRRYRGPKLPHQSFLP